MLKNSEVIFGQTKISPSPNTLIYSDIISFMLLISCRSHDLKLMLTEKTAKGKQSNEYMGYITLQCTLVPKTQDEKEQVINILMFLSYQIVDVDPETTHQTGWTLFW